MLRQRLLAIGIGLLIIVGGMMALRSLNIDAFPDITPARVEVDTSAPGMASEEVEKLVTHPLEVALQGIPKATRIQSISKFGVSVVTVYFEDGTDVYWARDQVFQQLAGRDDAAGHQPRDGSERHRHRPDLHLRGQERPALEHGPAHAPGLGDHARALKTVPGVADDLSFGGEVKQFQVLIDPGRAASATASALDDVSGAIGKNNQNSGGNFVQHGGLQYIVRGIGLLQTRRTTSATSSSTARKGVPIYVKNVGIGADRPGGPAGRGHRGRPGRGRRGHHDAAAGIQHRGGDRPRQEQARQRSGRTCRPMSRSFRSTTSPS